MRAMLSLWQHNPEGVPTTIQQEDDGSLNLSDVDIWMWLKFITPTKGVMMRQQLMQLFGEAGQWASLVDVSELPAPCSSKLHNSSWTEYKSRSQPTANMLLKDLAIGLGKQVGVTLTHMARVEEYAACALAKMAHSSASQLGKRLHEMAQTKDCLDCRKRQLIESNKLDSELLVITLTNQPSVMASSAIAPPPCAPEGGSTKIRPALAPYSDGNVFMGNVNDSVTDDIYQ